MKVAPRPESANILLVDDHPANLLALEATLAPLGQRLVHAHSGEEALRHLLQEEFACIVLDVRMPVLDGFQTAQLIRGRERSRHTPLLFLTAFHRDPADVLRGYAQGAVDYLVKPFDPGILRTKVAVFVDLHLRRERAREPQGLLREPGARLQRAREVLPLVDAVVAAAPVGIALLDPELRLLRINAALAALHGTDAEGALGRSLWELAPGTAAQVREQVRQVLATRRPLQGVPTAREVPPGSGRWRHYLCSYYPLRVGAQEAVGLILLDVTDPWAAQAALRQSLTLLADAGQRLLTSLDAQDTLASVARLIVEQVSDGCLVDLLDAHGELETAALAHVRPEQEAGLRALAGGALRRLRQGQLRALRERRTRVVPPGADDARGAPGPQTALVVPLYVGARALGTLSALYDGVPAPFGAEEVRVLEEVAASAALAIDHARRYGEAQAAIRVRDELIAVASHELRIPLTPLQMHLQALKQQLEALARVDPAVRGVPAALERMSRQVHKLAVLVDRLLDVSQAPARQPRLELEPVDLREVVREVLARSEDAAAAQDASLELAASPPVPGLWDGARLEQVVSSLIATCLQYGRGRPIHVSLGAHLGTAWLRVRDGGGGSPLEHRSRTLGTLERPGLAVTRQNVEALGGELRVRSLAGAGALFEVTLPQHLGLSPLTPLAGPEGDAAPH